MSKKKTARQKQARHNRRQAAQSKPAQQPEPDTSAAPGATPEMNAEPDAASWTAQPHHEYETLLTIAVPHGSARISICTDADDDARATIRRYWSTDGDGEWIERVKDLLTPAAPQVHLITQLIAGLSRATGAGDYSTPCVKCDATVFVTSRAALKELIRQGEITSYDGELVAPLCGPCHRARSKPLREKHATPEAAARKPATVLRGGLPVGKLAVGKPAPRRRAPELWRDQARAVEREKSEPHANARPVREAPPTLLLAYALFQQCSRSSDGTAPSLEELGTNGWCGMDIASEAEMLRILYQHQWIAVAEHSPHDTYVRLEQQNGTNDEGSPASYSVNLMHARWRPVVTAQLLAKTLGEAAQDRQQVQDWYVGDIRNMIVSDTVSYLDGLLIERYEYPPTPESRFSELTAAVLHGIDLGYTLGQLICLAWRAADSAIPWAQRTVRGYTTHAAASAAAISSLLKKIDYAYTRQQTVPEYDLPPWHHRAPAIGHIALHPVGPPDAMRACLPGFLNHLAATLDAARAPSDDDYRTTAQASLEIHQARSAL